jgi:hypothetical protein
MRLKNSTFLFDAGSGYATIGSITCDICKTEYNTDNGDNDGEIADYDREAVRHTDFAGLTVCECCFRVIEAEITGRIMDILPWLVSSLRRNQIEIYDRKNAILKLFKEITRVDDE